MDVPAALFSKRTRLSIKSTQQECSAGGTSGQGGNGAGWKRVTVLLMPRVGGGVLMSSFEYVQYFVGHILAADIIGS
jgi:hypothetical protein